MLYRSLVSLRSSVTTMIMVMHRLLTAMPRSQSLQICIWVHRLTQKEQHSTQPVPMGTILNDLDDENGATFASTAILGETVPVEIRATNLNFINSFVTGWPTGIRMAPLPLMNGLSSISRFLEIQVISSLIPRSLCRLMPPVTTRTSVFG